LRGGRRGRGRGGQQRRQVELARRCQHVAELVLEVVLRPALVDPRAPQLVAGEEQDDQPGSDERAAEAGEDAGQRDPPPGRAGDLRAAGAATAASTGAGAAAGTALALVARAAASLPRGRRGGGRRPGGGVLRAG